MNDPYAQWKAEKNKRNENIGKLYNFLLAS